MQDIHQLEQDKRDLQEALNGLKWTKYKKLIKSALTFPASMVLFFIFLSIPPRGSHQSIAESIGRETSFFLIGTICLVLLILGIINTLNDYKNRKFDIEYDIEVIESKIAKLNSSD